MAEIHAGRGLLDTSLVLAEGRSPYLPAEAAISTLTVAEVAAGVPAAGYDAVTAAGRSARPRAVDLMIAASALGHGVPLYTLNPEDLRGLEAIVEVVDCTAERPDR